MLQRKKIQKLNRFGTQLPKNCTKQNQYANYLKIEFFYCRQSRRFINDKKINLNCINVFRHVGIFKKRMKE